MYIYYFIDANYTIPELNAIRRSKLLKLNNNNYMNPLDNMTIKIENYNNNILSNNINNKLLKNKLISTNDICQICLDPYNYTILIENSNTLTGLVIDLLLNNNKYLLRPIILSSLLFTLTLFSTFLSSLISSPFIGDLIIINNQLINDFILNIIQLINIKPLTLNNIKNELNLILPNYYNTIKYSINILLKSIKQPINYSNNWLLRFITSKYFWQQYHIWSFIYNMPIILNLYLFKLLSDIIKNQYIYFEKIIIMLLIDLESKHIENNIIQNSI